MPVLMIFIDGVGIGNIDYNHNPFFKYGFRTFTELFGAIPCVDSPVLKGKNRYLFPADAALGMEGLPQSGTGQASIFCGFNAPAYVGKHFGPFPYSTTIPIIAEQNILKHYKDNGGRAVFVNAYPKRFFDYLKSGRTRLSVTTLMCRLSGIELNKAKDVHAGRALTAEITNERWRSKLKYKLPLITPQIAGERILRIAAQNDFTLYEYFITDHLGHGRYDGDIQYELKILDEFLYTVISKLKEDLTLVICSDHGNFEDLSVKTHTKNPSLLITAGKNSEALFEEIKNLTQIKDAVINSCN